MKRKKKLYFFPLIQNEDYQLVILMCLSCKLHGNQIYLQLSASSHRVWLQVLSVARLETSLNCCNWWWNIILPEAFLLLYRSFWIDILNKYVSGPLCFSEDYHQIFVILPQHCAKGGGQCLCPVHGSSTGWRSQKHPWLMSRLHPEATILMLPSWCLWWYV